MKMIPVALVPYVTFLSFTAWILTGHPYFLSTYCDLPPSPSSQTTEKGTKETCIHYHPYAIPTENLMLAREQVLLLERRWPGECLGVVDGSDGLVALTAAVRGHYGMWAPGVHTTRYLQTYFVAWKGVTSHLTVNSTDRGEWLSTKPVGRIFVYAEEKTKEKEEGDV
jgi:hypothetical protein